MSLMNQKNQEIRKRWIGFVVVVVMSVYVHTMCVCVFVCVCSSGVCQEEGSCSMFLAVCNASVIPLLDGSTVPAIKFPKPEKLN